MPKIDMNIDRLSYNIDDNKIGFKRKVFVNKFELDMINKKFNLLVEINHYENNNGEYGDKIDLRSVQNIYDTFVGDCFIMVSLEQGDNYGKILNPTRETVDVLYGTPRDIIETIISNEISRDVDGNIIYDSDNNPVMIEREIDIIKTIYDVAITYTSQYEFIYNLFKNEEIQVSELIGNLINSYDNWIDT